MERIFKNMGTDFAEQKAQEELMTQLLLQHVGNW